MGGRRPGDPGADGESPVARRVPDGPRDLVRHDGQRLPAAERSAGAAARLPAHAPSPAAVPDCGLCEVSRARCLAGAAGGPGAAQRSLALGPHLVPGLSAARRHRSRVSREPRAPRSGDRRPGRRPGLAFPRVQRAVEPARSRRHPEESAQPGTARSDRPRVCSLLFAGRGGAEQQDAGAMGSGDDRPRRRRQKERRHPDGGGTDAMRQAQPARRADQAAARVPAVLRSDAGGESPAAGLTMLELMARLMRGANRDTASYSRGLQIARVRASYQRAYFAPALFRLVPVQTDLIGSMAVDRFWRLYYNESWVATHTVEENATLLIHEVGHLLRDHEGRKKAADARNDYVWNTAADCEINDDLAAEGLPLPGDPPQPATYGLPTGETAEVYYRHLYKPVRPDKDARKAPENDTQQKYDCGSGAHGERRAWELPDEDGSSTGVPGVDAVKAELVRREVAQRILELSRDRDSIIPLGWRRWAHSLLTPRV